MRLRIKEEQLNRLFIEEKDVPPFIADKFTIGDEGGNLEYAHVVNENAENEMRAYHGSGADFDRFDNSFVGSGEGAQAFGWGAYVTTDMGTAKHYAQIAHDNGNGTTYLCNGYKITKEIYVVLSMAMEHAKGNDEICSFLIDKINSLKNTLSIKTSKGSDNFELEKIKNRIEDNENALEYVKGLCGIDIKSLNSCKSGQIIYEVEIPDDNGNNYIDWKFTKYDVIERILSNLTYLRYPNIDPKRISFEDIYELNIQSDKYHKAIEPKRISEDLYKLGFNGIKVPVGYLSNDNSHRGYNYVIFNEDDIEIIEKYDMFENTKKSHIIDEENIVFPNSKVQDVMYRGDNEDISTFDRKYSKKTNLYGTGFYFTNEPSHAMTYGKSKTYYLNIENPLNTDKLTITPQMVFNIVKAVAENEDYGIENYGYGATVKSVADMLMKEHNTDFSILYDLNQTCVGDLVELTLLFNKINKTTFDGFILPTETVVFDDSQIKRTENEQLRENTETEMQVYHGSSADFDKFDFKFLGTGEGAQYYGYGMYVTTDRATGEYYAEVASNNSQGYWLLNGIKYDDDFAPNELYRIYYALEKQGIDPNIKQNHIDFINNEIQEIEKDSEITDSYKEGETDRLIWNRKRVLKLYDDIKGDIIEEPEYVTKKQILYHVDIPDDNGNNYLAYNGWLGHKCTDIIDELVYLAKQNPYLDVEDITWLALKPYCSGGDAYWSISRFLGSDKAASELLYKVGYDGIRVPTGLLHNGGDGKGYNYVIFNTNDMEILNKEELPYLKENIENEYQAYHGSSFNFDKFNHKKYLSRGAGSQSFGWGTYVTDDVTIAQSYANLDPDTRGGVTIDGIYYNNLLDISDAISDIIWTDLANNYPNVTNLDILSHNTNKRYVEDVLTDFLLDTITDNQKYFIQTKVQDFQRKIQEPYWWSNENPESIMQSVIYLCKYLLLTKHQIEYQETENKQMLYTVDIPDDNGSNYIEWYELFPHDFMKRILIKMSQLKPSYLQKMAQNNYGFRSELYKYLTAPNVEQIIDFLITKGQSEDWDEFFANGFTTSKKEKTGEGVYHRLKEIFKSDKAASLFLIQCGFVGIKYPTGTKWSKPQGAKDDAYNYVIFDANNVKITNKQNLGESKQLTEAKNEMIVSAANYIFCEDENGELNILIGKRGSTAPQGANQWNVPMGMKEPNEEIIDTACRETFEETGLRIPKDTMEYIGNSSYGDGVRCGANFVTNLEGTTNQYQTGNGDGENSRFIWIPVSEIDNFTFAFGLDKTIKNILKTL